MTFDKTETDLFTEGFHCNKNTSLSVVTNQWLETVKVCHNNTSGLYSINFGINIGMEMSLL